MALMLYNLQILPQNVFSAHGVNQGYLHAGELNIRWHKVNTFCMMQDTLSGLENWYYTEICRDGAVDSPAQARAALEAVTADQVRQVLRMFSLSVRYLLTPKVAQEDA